MEILPEYQLKGFDKLYGKVVTEAHLLLKNNYDSHELRVIRLFFQYAH
jgi:hypothetical protein